MNLAVNARDAMPAGGTLVLETRNVELDEAGCAPWPGAAPGRHVRLTVRDDGTGMPPEVMVRVFEPFFTTKPAGLGTGLGLATVHGIVRQSGGFIRIESTVGKGTTVACLFPAVPGPPVRGVARRPAPARGGQETVLLVEDDAQVREVLRRALLSGGYRVLAARDGAEALSLVLSGEPIQVVVADGILPGAGGREVVEAIRARRPEVVALLVSGHPRPAAGQDDPAEAGLEILTKPFTGGELLERIRQALDRRA
jgi:CheY-like chemotaxis protein